VQCQGAGPHKHMSIGHRRIVAERPLQCSHLYDTSGANGAANHLAGCAPIILVARHACMACTRYSYDAPVWYGGTANDMRQRTIRASDRLHDASSELGDDEGMSDEQMLNTESDKGE